MNRMPALLSALLVAWPGTGSAQKNPPPVARAERYVHGGAGAVAGSSGFGLSLDLTVNRVTHLYRGRLTFMDTGIMSMGATGEQSTVAEMALMRGRGHRFTRNHGSWAAGLALVSHTGGTPPEERVSVGIPVEAQLISGGPLRLGASLFANLNALRPFAGFILSVQVGRVP